MRSIRGGWAPFVFSFALIALLTKTTPESAHEYSRLGTVESIVERGTYQLDESIFITTLDKIYRDGHYYSHQTPLLATLSAPLYSVLRLPGARFNNRGRLVLTYLFSLFTNGLAMALTVLVLWHVLVLAGAGPPRRGVFAVILPFGTWLLPYGIVSNNHGISAALLAVTAYALLLIDWHGTTRKRIIVLGAALGLAGAIELLPLISFVPLTILFLLRRQDLNPRHWRDFLVMLIAPMAIQATINIAITGDVIPAGFHHELFTYPGSPFTEAALTGTMKYESPGAFLDYVWAALFAGKGYFTFAPVLLLGVIAAAIEWRWWARARGAQMVMLGGVAVSLVASLLTTNQFGGAAVGFRHAAYLAPAMLIMLLPWLTDATTTSLSLRAVVLIVSAVSVANMLVFATPNPWSSLTVAAARTGSLEDYLPLLARIAGGTLLSP